MVYGLAIVTHPQPSYDPNGSIAAAVSKLSGLEIVILRNDVVPKSAGMVVSSQQNVAGYGIDAQLKEQVLYSYDGQLKPEEAQAIVGSYDAISILGGCLDSCHFRTYKSLIDAFKNSPKKRLTIRFFLDGIFNDCFASIPVTFNLNEILDFNGDAEQGEARDKGVAFMFQPHIFYLSIAGINCSLTYNGRLLYSDNQMHDRTLNIDVFDAVAKPVSQQQSTASHSLSQNL